jgi:hypothetical protein
MASGRGRSRHVTGGPLARIGAAGPADLVDKDALPGFGGDEALREIQRRVADDRLYKDLLACTKTE